ncbi:hypothetical protein [Oribacterium sp. WCC10]|uniref:hypothetical protein n=1 Tax=Oribacterium sp. WCC10 TaxID=1855343 RepID=UPI0008EF22CB|nr:hypothetical protein [Oribacterium sp. WCC10]SFG73506.1 hypothetical protein SAMN05216356_12233 [Oribacterium sp. WCC10]
MKLTKKLIAFLATVTTVSAFGFTGMAGSWAWIDTNGDGLAECYYFNDDGTLHSGGLTDDGYTVDSTGAWTVNGEVCRRSVLTDKSHENIAFSGTTDTTSSFNGRYKFKSAESMNMSVPFSGVDILTLQVNIDTAQNLNLSIAYEDGQIGTITLPIEQDGSYIMTTTGGNVKISFTEDTMTWSGEYYGIPTVLTAVKEK